MYIVATLILSFGCIGCGPVEIEKPQATQPTAGQRHFVRVRIARPFSEVVGLKGNGIDGFLRGSSGYSWRKVEVELPDGARYQTSAFKTNTHEMNGRIASVRMLLNDKSEPLADAIKRIEQLLEDWRVQPPPELSAMIQYMRDSVPTQGQLWARLESVDGKPPATSIDLNTGPIGRAYFPTMFKRIKFPGVANLDIEVRHVVTKGDRYFVSATFSAWDKKWDEPSTQPATTQPAVDE